MNRTIKRAAVLLTALGMSCLPGTALAETRGTAPIVIVGNGNQVAGGDIFNAGHSNIVGSGDGAPTDEGPGAPVGAQQEVATIQTGFDRVTLVSKTGDASFAPNIDFNVRTQVSLTVNSTAVYRGMNTDYLVNLTVSSGGQIGASCEPSARSGRCEVRYSSSGPTVTMG